MELSAPEKQILLPFNLLLSINHQWRWNEGPYHLPREAYGKFTLKIYLNVQH